MNAMRKMTSPLRTIAAFSIAAACSGVLAGTAADPTQPNAKWLAAARAANPGATQQPEQPMQTQVIVFGAERKLAIVDGVLVRLGETYNGDRLVGMKRNEVIWKRTQTPAPDTPRPAIRKTIIKPGGTQ